jgi:V8-like Glu-specific endopeptidase
MTKPFWTVSPCVSVFAAFVLGCGGVATAPSEPPGQVERNVEPSAAATVDGAITVDGRIYVPLTEADNAPASWGSKLLSEMTVEELAEATTARLGVYDGNGGTKMYRALKPDLITAQVIRAQESQPGGPPMMTAPGHIIDTSVSEKPDWLLNAVNPGVPQTNDPRVQPNNPFAYPYSTIVFVQQSDGSSCTGTYVGSHSDTMLLAAHCNRTNGSSHSPSSVTPADLNGYAPYGTFSGCYNWWYPSAWDTAISGGCPGSSACWQYDYSVIDYRPCGNPTIASTGTMGFTENSGGSQWASGVYHYGFPGWYTVGGSPPDTTGQPTGIGNPPCGGGINPSGEFPFLCGAGLLPSQSVKFQLYNGSSCGSSGYDFVANAITSSQGDSGGPWWYINGTTPYEFAIERGDNSVCSGRWNDARYIDTTVWNFIFAHSNP